MGFNGDLARQQFWEANVRFGANEISPLNDLRWLTTHSGAIDRKREFSAVANADRDESCGCASWQRLTSFARQPCFATRFGGVSGGKDTQTWRDSSHTAMVGGGKFGSAKLPIATATYPGKPSLSQ